LQFTAPFAKTLLSAASQLIFAHGVALPSCISGSRFVLAQKSDWICIWRMYDSELLSELPYNQAGVSMPDYRAALVVKALEIEYNIFNV